MVSPTDTIVTSSAPMDMNGHTAVQPPDLLDSLTFASNLTLFRLVDSTSLLVTHPYLRSWKSESNSSDAATGGTHVTLHSYCFFDLGWFNMTTGIPSFRVLCSQELQD